MYRMYGLRGSPGRSWLRKENTRRFGNGKGPSEEEEETRGENRGLVTESLCRFHIALIRHVPVYIDTGFKIHTHDLDPAGQTIVYLKPSPPPRSLLNCFE